MKRSSLSSLSIYLFALLMMSTTLAACTSDIEDAITFDTYYNRLQEEYAKYGIGYTLEKDESKEHIYTQKMLDEALSQVKAFAESIEVKTSVSVDSSELIEMLNEMYKDNSTQANMDGQGRVMPVSGIQFALETKVSVSGGMGQVTYKALGTVTLNVQNDYVMSVDWFDVQQVGFARNYVGTDSQEKNCALNSPSQGYITPFFGGWANFKWKDVYNQEATYRVAYVAQDTFFVPDLM